MAQPRVPLNVCTAARLGNYALVEEWLANGGDANLNLAPEFYEEEAWNVSTFSFRMAAPHHQLGCRLLLYAAEWGQLEVIRALLAHGADVNYVHRYMSNGWAEEKTALLLAVEGAFNRPARGDYHDIVALLFQNDANVLPIMDHALQEHSLLRMALATGVDITVPCCEIGITMKTPEFAARYWYSLWQYRPGDLPNRFAGSVAMLEGTRLAGSYKNYVLQEFKGLLRLRSLLARDRASIGARAPNVVARLFGGRVARTRSGATLAPARGSQGVPGPVFWKVMEYWRLGDWRRPRWRRPE